MNAKDGRCYDGCPVNFISWNVKSLNHPVKYRKIFAHLKRSKIDIAFLQETHIRVSDRSRLHRGWVGQVYQPNLHSKSRGVAIMISKNVSFMATEVHTDPAGRCVIVVGRLYTLPVILACIYGPNGDDPNFFTSLFSHMPNMATHHLILGGDTNCVLSPFLDRSISKKAPLSKSAHAIQLFLETYGVVDVWRFYNPTSRAYSFYSPVHKTFSRIDHFFIDKRILHSTKNCDYGAIVISDHGPLSMKLQIPNIKQGHRQWRLNPLLLSEEEFNNFILTEIKTFLDINQTPGMPASIVWESLKAYLRGQVISYCANKKRTTSEYITK